MDYRLSVQQLDDNTVAGRKGLQELRRYYKRYREIAKYVGNASPWLTRANPRRLPPPSQGECWESPMTWKLRCGTWMSTGGA